MSSTTSVRKKEIRSVFSKAGLSKLNDDIVSKCIALSSSYNISPDQMGLCWEAFSLNRNLQSLDEHCFESFRAAIMKYADNAPKSQPDTVISRPAKRTPPPSVTPPAKRQQQQGIGAQINDSQARRISLSPDAPTSNPKPTLLYEERKSAGQVVHTYNPNDIDEDDRREKPLTIQRCQISVNAFPNVDKKYRHMNTTIDEKARVLDKRLNDIGDKMADRYGLGVRPEGSNADEAVAGLEAVGIPRQEPVCCIGRICNEAQEGRINATSILLEGARDSSGGARIQLNVSHLKSNKTPFSLFPGQIVAVEGLNPSGREMMAHRLCEGVAPESIKTPAKELLKFHHDEEQQNGQPLKIMSVAGPFSTTDGLNYQPLWDFMHKVQVESPDVVIMMGPFVDMRQDSAKSGHTTIQNEDGTETLLSFEAFFAEQISAVLQEFFTGDDIATQFVLVPSVDDATSGTVFPQAPFADEHDCPEFKALAKVPGANNAIIGTLDLGAIETSSKGHRRVHCVSNPCTFKINELVVGVTSADVLFHLGTGEANANLPPGSRMERLAQHLIQQQSYYPLFPPSKDMNIDLKQMERFSMPCQPDILITPSKLGPFARAVADKTLVINPGTLTKGSTGGTFATAQIAPMKRESLDDLVDGNLELAHNVAERSRVVIQRI